MLSKKKAREETPIQTNEATKKSSKNKKKINNYTVSIIIPSSVVDNAQVKLFYLNCHSQKN